MPSFRKPLNSLQTYLQLKRAYDNLCIIAGYRREDGSIRERNVRGVTYLHDGKLGYIGKK